MATSIFTKKKPQVILCEDSLHLSTAAHPIIITERNLCGTSYVRIVYWHDQYMILLIPCKFTKDPNELMPVSKLRALLNAGHKKKKTIHNQKWMRCMGQEAIHQYKKTEIWKIQRDGSGRKLI